jgi:hypothetical protein
MTDISNVKISQDSDLKEDLKQKDFEEEVGSSEQTHEKDLKVNEKIFLIDRASGNKIEVFSGDIIGRSNKGREVFEKLNNPKIISRLHCQIVFREDKWNLVDLNSTNNTFLNGFKLIPDRFYELKNGDVVNLAGVVDFEVLIEP